jgi:uncharacterized membrane protein YfcA
MHSILAVNPLYSVSGFGVGLLVGLTGVGGGSLMTPLLVLLFGIHPTTAVGTDLLYASVTKTAGTFVHGFSKTVDWRITGFLALGSVPATCLTLLVLHYAGTPDQLSGTISTILGFALILTAVTMVWRRWILEFVAKRMGEIDPTRASVLTVATGVVLGVLVSLSSVGAGALGVTVLLMLYPKLPTVRIVGSDIAHAVPLTLLAGLGHWLMGSVDLGLLSSLLTGSLPGIVIGSLVASRVPDRVLRPILAGTLMLVGSKLAF